MIVCLVVLRRLDESIAGVFEEGVSVEQKEQDQGHFVEQGKLFSELASIYIYFGSYVFHINSRSDLCGVCHKSYDFENPFPKYEYISETPDIEVLVVCSNF